ncbi:MAG TPA: histidine kinase, partial [Bacillota bacterium]|nr:histidine kinase [Bacillota bacterium]
SEDVYTIMKALGSYYRISLSKGSQIITIGEELETVKNYLTIQQIRYGDLFTAVYEVDESVLRARTLKLILQPLVENAIYHGIRPKGEKGTIIVSVKGCPDCIELKVADDGVGMEQTTMVAILSAEPTANRGSFGLRGTIERLRIFYGIENILLIDSEIGKGTTLTIRIPFEESC